LATGWQLLGNVQIEVATDVCSVTLFVLSQKYLMTYVESCQQPTTPTGNMGGNRLATALSGGSQQGNWPLLTKSTAGSTISWQRPHRPRFQWAIAAAPAPQTLYPRPIQALRISENRSDDWQLSHLKSPVAKPSTSRRGKQVDQEMFDQTIEN
jgi:hypothetical protein